MSDGHVAAPLRKYVPANATAVAPRAREANDCGVVARMIRGDLLVCGVGGRCERGCLDRGKGALYRGEVS